MYEVMARRYRPATFDEVIGQEHIATTLKNAIFRDRVAHAYMFTGGHGCGKTTMARILAKALVCQNGPTPKPCGVCPVCVDVAAGRDSDVLEIDGASNNGIEQIRQLREQAAYVPTRARFKIYIIDEVHMLSDGAFNALLKTLEEPPRHVKFILATTDPHKVPDTILSRCQRFDFRLVSQTKLAAFFHRLAGEEGAAITDEALEAVAAFAEGSVRDGLVLLDQLLSFADSEIQRQDVEAVRGVASAENVAGVFAAIHRTDVAKALAIVDEVASRGTNVGDFLDQLVSFGRDLMILAAGGPVDSVAAYGPARDMLLELGKTISLEKALLYLDVLTQARTRVRIRALTNPLVALEMAVARLAGLGAIAPVSELLAKLNQVSVPGPRPVPGIAVPEPKPTRKSELAAHAGNEQTRFLAAIAPAPGISPAEHEEPPRIEAVAPVFPSTDDVVNKPTELPVEPMPERDFSTFSPERAKAVWSHILDCLADTYPADLRHLAKVNMDGIENGILSMTGPGVAVEALQDKRRLARLKEAAEKAVGMPIDIEFKTVRQGHRSTSGQESNSGAEYSMIRQPTVAKIKTLFDGVVVDFQANESVSGCGFIDNEGDGE